MNRNILIALMLPIVCAGSIQGQDIKKFVDNDFLLLLEKTRADNDTLVGNVHIRFYTISPRSECADKENPVVAYLYLANRGSCTEKQLIKLPGSARWKLIDCKEKGSTAIELTLTRRVMAGEQGTNEEWIVTGNGFQYGIAKKTFK